MKKKQLKYLIKSKIKIITNIISAYLLFSVKKMQII